MSKSKEQFQVLIIPGLSGSGEGHWQTLWEVKHPSFKRIEQRDWEQPECSEWLTQIDEAVKEQVALNQKVILVAHSLGCSAVAHWAAAYPELAPAVHGVLLVAPADVDAFGMPPQVKSFSPMPIFRLPFSSIVVASQNDPYVSLARAEFFSQSWGSQFVDVGLAGHINTAAGFGVWPEGEQLLHRLLPA